MPKYEMLPYRLLYYKTNSNLIHSALKRLTDRLRTVTLLAVINSSIYSFMWQMLVAYILSAG